MSTNVYANGDEICCKSADGKTSVAFPDPCWSPPPPPAGPIVLPYPNSAGPSSLKKGSSTVRIKRSAVALTDRSYFSTSTGDEPATPAFQKGLLTRKLKGKTYFKQWSMNVKFEGKGVCRNVDLMTHNHGSQMGNTATFPFLDGMDKKGEDGEPCKKEMDAIKEKCSEGLKDGQNWSDKHCGVRILQIRPQTDDATKVNCLQDQLEKVGLQRNRYRNLNTFTQEQVTRARNNPCLTAKKCELVKYSETQTKKGEKGNFEGCCHGQTGHHVIPDGMASKAGCDGYDMKDAPVICVEGSSQFRGSHEKMHAKLADNLQGKVIAKALATGSSAGDVKFSMKDVIDSGAKSVKKVFPESGCSTRCLQKQLKGYYKNCSEEMGPVGKDAKSLNEGALNEMQGRIIELRSRGGNILP